MLQNFFFLQNPTGLYKPIKPVWIRSWLIFQQSIAQLIGNPGHLRFNVLIGEDAKGLQFADVNVKAALSPHLL